MILGSSRECVFVYGAVFCGLSEELFRYGGRRWRRSARVATLCHHSRTYWHLGLLHPTVLCELGSSTFSSSWTCFSFYFLFAGVLFSSEPFDCFNVFFGKSFIRVTFCCQLFCSIFLYSSQNSPHLLSPSLLHAP